MNRKNEIKAQYLDKVMLNEFEKKSIAERGLAIIKDAIINIHKPVIEYRTGKNNTHIITTDPKKWVEYFNQK